MKRLLLILTATLFIVSCGQKSAEENEETTTDEAVYRLNLKSTKLEWEAYKFTEKKGVKGTFDSIQITPAVEAGSLEEMINGLTFSINVASTNSGDEIRDPKIVASFFGSMMNTNTIEGKITSYEKTSDTEASVNVDITMNDKTVSVPSKIQIGDKSVQLTTAIEMGSWDANSSIDSLNTVCEDLHKGEDGTSKLWPDVSITVTSSYFEAEAS